MKLYGVNVGKILYDAVKSVGDAAPITLTRVTPGTRNPAAPLDGTNPTTTTHAARGFRNDDDVNSQGARLTSGDVVKVTWTDVYVYDQSIVPHVEPRQGDVLDLVEDGVTTRWYVENVKRDPFRAVFTCRAKNQG